MCCVLLLLDVCQHVVPSHLQKIVDTDNTVFESTLSELRAAEVQFVCTNSVLVHRKSVFSFSIHTRVRVGLSFVLCPLSFVDTGKKYTGSSRQRDEETLLWVVSTS